MRKRRVVFFLGIEIGSDPAEVDEEMPVASGIGFTYDPTPPAYEIDNGIDPDWDDRKVGFR